MIIFEDSFKCFVNNLRYDNEKEGNPRNKHSNLTQDVEKKILEVGLARCALPEADYHFPAGIFVAQKEKGERL